MQGILIPPMPVPWNRGYVAMVLTGIKLMSHAPMGALCVLHSLSMDSSMAMWNMHQPTACGAQQTLPGLDIPPQTVTMLN